MSAVNEDTYVDDIITGKDEESDAIDLVKGVSETLLRWLGTVVTSHTASNWQAYTPVMSMLQKAVQSTHCKSHCTSCNQPAHTIVIMLYAVKCSLYVVLPWPKKLKQPRARGTGA